MGGRVGGQRKCVRGRGGSVGGKTNVVLEKEGNTKDLSGERIIESVGIPEEKVKLNTPVPALHIFFLIRHPIPSFHRYQIRLPRSPSKMCQRNGREQRRWETLSCRKRR